MLKCLLDISGIFSGFCFGLYIHSEAILYNYNLLPTVVVLFFFSILLGGNTKHYSRKQRIKRALNGICCQNTELQSLAQKKVVYIACRRGDDGEERL